VVSHPFFGVSGADGSFSIEKLPPGSYALEAWHERLGTKMSSDVVVSDNQPTKVAFEFSAP
jgi:hypothetical protein